MCHEKQLLSKVMAIFLIDMLISLVFDITKTNYYFKVVVSAKQSQMVGIIEIGFISSFSSSQ